MSGSESLMASSYGAQAISSVGSGFTQYSALKSQARFQKQIADINSKLAKFQSDDALRRGESEAKAYKKEVKKTIGAQRVALAAQGIDIASGSALDLQEDTARIGAINAITIKNNAWREAWGHKAEGLNNFYQGKYNAMASNAQAGSTLLTGGLGFLSYGLAAGSKVKGSA